MHKKQSHLDLTKGHKAYRNFAENEVEINAQTELRIAKTTPYDF